MPKIRVLIVDDAVVMRRMISEALSRDPDIEVVGVAANGRIALARVPQLNPDVLTMDVEMPELDGVATVTELRKTHPKLPVIMFSTLTQRGAATTLDALARGANDYVTKPANVGSIAEGLKRLQDDLIPKIKLHYHNTHRQSSPALSPLAPGPSPTTAPRPSPLAFRAPLPTGPAAPIDAVCIGCSTGGPNALVELFAHLPPHPPTPFFIVQHMPPLFTAMLAERLGKVSALRFYEAKHDQTIEPGCVYVAPGGHHLEIRRDARGTPKAFLHDDAAENSCRPAVDVLFRSAAAAYGCNCLGVILTGMGQDGLRGCELLREKNARILAQDEATSVVWGMPGAVTNAGLAEKVLPLNQIAGEISRRLNLPRPILAAASRS